MPSSHFGQLISRNETQIRIEVKAKSASEVDEVLAQLKFRRTKSQPPSSTESPSADPNLDPVNSVPMQFNEEDSSNVKDEITRLEGDLKKYDFTATHQKKTMSATARREWILFIVIY